MLNWGETSLAGSWDRGSSSPLSLPPANAIRYRIINSAGGGALRVSTLCCSVTFTMNIDINIGIHGGAIVSALVALAGVQLGLDIVTVSPGSVSRRGKGLFE